MVLFTLCLIGLFMYDIFHACSEGIANISNTVILIMLSSETAFCCHIRVILHVHDSVHGFYKNIKKNVVIFIGSVRINCKENTDRALQHKLCH